VPWQQGIRIGLAVGLEEVRGAASLELREVIATLDASPFVSETGLQLIGSVAELTCAAPGRVLANLLATGLQEPLEHEVRALEEVRDIGLPTDRWTSAEEITPRKLDLYRRQGLIAERVRPCPARVRVLQALHRADETLQGSRQANQRTALELLWEREYAESAAELSREAEVPESAVRALIRKGYAAYEEVEAPPPALPHYHCGGKKLCESRLHLPADVSHLRLSGGLRWQRLAEISPLLKVDIAAGESVLVLAPEQAVLTETTAALAAELPVLPLSGELSDRQRTKLWAQLSSGEPVVLVASYFGLLAPLARLGRVVVLEAANPSYKLQAGCRAFVPAVARELARLSGAKLLLADVFPTPERGVVAEDRLPLITERLHVVNLGEGRGWPLSSDLTRVLKQVAERGRQAVLLAPRRGFSGALGCSACDWRAMCPNCDLPLRYHQERSRLRCHQCGHEERAPDLCPQCANPSVSPKQAAGTQWLVTAVKKLLPDFPVKRFDGDKKDDLAGLFEGEPGVLVATTAIFRQPPLPNVSLLAVTLLDTLLNLSDFRADEDAYRFLLNVAELAPEKRPLLLVQTFQPNHPILTAYRQGEAGAKAFTAALLARRERFHYPPYSVIAKLQLSARQEAAAHEAASWLAGAIRTQGTAPAELLGPSPAPVARVRGRYSYHLFVRSESRARLRELLAPALAYRGQGRLRIDVEPRDTVSFLE
jgi:primosomal protein N' (replication factor Y)